MDYNFLFFLLAEDISQSLPNIINAEDSLTPNTQPTDLTKLFALNQSLDEAALKNKSFFASLKGWNEKSASSSTASKENVSSTEFSGWCLNDIFSNSLRGQTGPLIIRFTILQIETLKKP